MENDELDNAPYDMSEIKSKKPIIDKSNIRIRAICEDFDKGKLIADPDFQREYVWGKKPVLKSRLIESILLNFPIPAVYTFETNDGNEEVIDGQQRITTFVKFKNNDFALKNLNILSELENKRFRDLDPKIQDQFLNATVDVIKIDNRSDVDIKFEIFSRLNKGSIQLNAQELRNCIFRGSLNKLLKDLRDDKDFLNLQGLEKHDERMNDAERILRFFAFTELGYAQYRQPLKKFLNDYMNNNRNLPDKKIEKMKKSFKKCVGLCNQIFGETAFKKYNLGTDENQNGNFDNTLNLGIFDMQLCEFSKYDKSKLVNKTEIIKDAFIKLISKNEIRDTIEKGTGDKKRVQLRMRMWEDTLRDIVGDDDDATRFFTFNDKKILFDNCNQICAICKNKIFNIEDAHVDHIVRHSEGGPTILDNAQITHRYCNLSKG